METTLEDIILNYIYEHEQGEVTDIIKYLSKQNIEIKQTIEELKSLILDLLKNNPNIKISSFMDKFYLNKDEKTKKYLNEFFSIQNMIVGTIKCEEKINFNQILNYMKEKLSIFGKINVNEPDNQNNYITGFFEFNDSIFNFIFNEKTFNIRGMMKEIIEEQDPFLEYLFSLPKGFKKEYGSYIPLNFGLYLIYKSFMDSIKLLPYDFKIAIDYLEYKK